MQSSGYYFLCIEVILTILSPFISKTNDKKPMGKLKKISLQIYYFLTFFLTEVSLVKRLNEDVCFRKLFKPEFIANFKVILMWPLSG